MTVLGKIDTVIIHVPKTGGSSVRWPAIRKFGVRYSCQHCNYSSLPDKYKDFRKITFVRHPLDWYASRFFFDKKKFHNDKTIKFEPFSDALSNEYKLSFKETLPMMLDLTEAFRNEEILNLFKKRLTFEVTNNYQSWWVSYFDDINEITAESFEHKSLYQWFCDIQGVDNCDAVYRLEDQHESGMKREFGDGVNIVHRNKTGRKSNSEIYEKEMIEKFLNKEKEFIMKYYTKYD
jgi:hypothetical protein